MPSSFCWDLLTGSSHWEAPHTKGKKSKVSATKGSQWCLLAAETPITLGEGAGIHIWHTNPSLLQRQWCCTTLSIISWHLYCEINFFFFCTCMQKKSMLCAQRLDRLRILKLSVGLGTFWPLTAKSHCLSSCLLAQFKIHKAWMMPTGMVVLRKEKNQTSLRVNTCCNPFCCECLAAASVCKLATLLCAVVSWGAACANPSF